MGEKSIELKILTKEGIRFNGSASSVTVPSLTGEITILAQHIPLLSGLKEGTLKVSSAGKTVEKIKISSGFIRFINNVCVITIDEIKLNKAS